MVFRIRVVVTGAILSLVWQSAFAQRCTVRVIARISPAGVQPQIYAEYDGIRRSCAITTSGCEFAVYSGLPRAFTIALEAYGFKPYRRNVLDSLCKNKEAAVDLGNVVLTESGVPRVVQTIKATGRTGTTRMRLVLSNPREKDVFIRELTLVGSRRRWLSNCTSDGSPTYEYKVAGKVEVTSGEGDKNVSGTFVEMTENPNFSVDWSGILHIEACDAIDSITMTLPLAVALRAKKLTSISVELPSRFSVRESGFDIVTEHIEYYIFKLFSDDPEAREIPGSYGTDPHGNY